MVTPLFDVEYLRNGTIYTYSYKGILLGSYTHTPYSTISVTSQSYQRHGALCDLSAIAELFVNTECHILGMGVSVNLLTG